MQFVRDSVYREGNTVHSTIPAVLKPQSLKELYRANTAAWYFGSCDKSVTLLNCLRFDASSRVRIPGAYFEMAYGLWDACFLESLPECLSDDELAQASVLCYKLTDFLLSGQCLKWIEMAIIINYAGRYTNLFENAVRALSAADGSMRITDRSSNSKLLPAFQSFSVARRCFFADYAYVISCTGPTDNQKMALPEGFESRRLANNLMLLGRRWKQLYDDPDLTFSR